MNNHKYCIFVLLVCQAGLLTGCTGMLWQKERFARFHRPANPPNLELFYSQSARDVLAEYDEVSEGTPGVQRRAYWLEIRAPCAAASPPVLRRRLSGFQRVGHS